MNCGIVLETRARLKRPVKYDISTYSWFKLDTHVTVNVDNIGIMSGCVFCYYCARSNIRLPSIIWHRKQFNVSFQCSA